MQKRVLLIVHQKTSDPGRVGAMLAEAGCALDLRRIALGDKLPEDPAEFDGAVVFGGPMSANDDHLPFIRAELDWIPRFVESGKPFLGICLGGQLLARAHGARVGRDAGGRYEIGYYRLTPTAEGRAFFPPDLRVFQWHGEGFETPTGATRLAAGEIFPDQAFRLGQAAFGVQFHPDVTPEIMRRWTAHAPHRLTLPGAQPLAEQEILAARHDSDTERWLKTFLATWLEGATAESVRMG